MTAAAVSHSGAGVHDGPGARAARKGGSSGRRSGSGGQEAIPLSTAALTQLLGPANSALLARHLHPELLEGLDLALATVDPSKVPEHLMLKAFESLPGASAHLQQVLGAGGEGAAQLLATSLQPPLECLAGGAKGGLAPGDYLVLQTPVLQAAPASPDRGKQAPPDKAAPPTAPQAAGSPKGAKPEAKAGAGPGAGPSGGGGWQQEQGSLLAEVQALRRHKEWADQKIDQLIRRVRDAEGPQRLLKDEVQQLRLEKDSVEGKLRDFEASLQKLKDCTYSEAAQRREYELSLRNAQAELRGAGLREQEVANHMRDAQAALRAERKKREAAERQLRRAAEERAEAQAASAEAAALAARMERSLAAAQQGLQEQLAEWGQARDALLAQQQQAESAEQRAEALQAQLASAHADAAARAAELEGVIAALTAQLDEAQPPAGPPDASLYSHFGGPQLFGGGASWLHNSAFAGLPAMNSFAVGLEGFPPAFGPGGAAPSGAPPARQPAPVRPGGGGLEVP